MTSLRETVRYLGGSVEGLEALHATFIEHRYPVHVHDHWTVAWIEAGAAQFRLGREDRRAGPDDVVIIPPGVAHSGRPADGRGYRYRALYIDTEALGITARLPGSARVPNAPPSFRRSLQAVHTALVRGVGAEGDALLAVGSLLDLPQLTSRRPQSYVPRVRAYIAEHRTEKLSMAELAELANTDRFTLVRAFTTEIGISPHRYQIALRVEHAKRLLRTDMPLARVAAECGFHDQPHLTRAFRAHVGISPGRFRAMD